MKTLYPFQHAGADFLLNGGSLLAFQPGAGKTVTALEACKRAGARRVLVVCPAVALAVWRDEVRDHWPECQPVYLRDLVKAPADAFYRLCASNRPFLVITGYEFLVINQRAREIVASSRYDVLICDEAHNLKSPTAKRTMLVYGPSCAGNDGLVSLAERTWLLTGTPVLNHAGEVFSHLRALAPERIAERSYQGFTYKYCEIGVRTVFTRSGNQRAIGVITGSNRGMLPDLAKRLRGFWLKPKLEELIAQLPSLKLVVRTLAPDACDAKALNEVEESEEATLLRAAIEKNQDLDGMEIQVSRLRRLLAMAKVKATVEWVEELFDEGVEKVGIWGVHVAALEMITAKLEDYGAVTITGATRPKDRETRVKLFQEDLGCRAFVGQIQAAGTAITLTAAHRAVFLEMMWTPALNYQALKRHHRIGQTMPVLGEVLVIDGSIDEAVGRTLARKSAEIEMLEESA